MTHPVVRKLECFGPLPEDDKALLESIIALEQEFPAQFDLIREGDDPNVVHLVTGGFACRYKRLADGRRQIVAFLVPGDFGDPYAFFLKSMDHNISTLAPSKLGFALSISFRMGLRGFRSRKTSLVTQWGCRPSIQIGHYAFCEKKVS